MTRCGGFAFVGGGPGAGFGGGAIPGEGAGLAPGNGDGGLGIAQRRPCSHGISKHRWIVPILRCSFRRRRKIRNARWWRGIHGLESGTVGQGMASVGWRVGRSPWHGCRWRVTSRSHGCHGTCRRRSSLGSDRRYMSCW